MKKVLLAFIPLILGFTSCKMETDAHRESVSTEVIEEYSTDSVEIVDTLIIQE